MIRNYIVTAIRNFTKNKFYTFINIAGLSIGITCSILILLWVFDELSFDKFHPELKDAICYHIYACLNKPIDPDELLYWLKCIQEDDTESRGSPTVESGI